MTTRGMKVKEMEIMAELIAMVLKNIRDDNEAVIVEVAGRVKELCETFPLHN